MSEKMQAPDKAREAAKEYCDRHFPHRDWSYDTRWKVVTSFIAGWEAAQSQQNAALETLRAQREAAMTVTNSAGLPNARAYADSETDGEQGEVWENTVNDFLMGWNELAILVRAALGAEGNDNG